MKIKYGSLVAAVLLAAVLSPLSKDLIARGQAGPAAAPAPAAPAGSTMAVVNIVELFDKLLEKKSADTELTNLSKQMDEAKATREAALDKIRKALSTYNPTSKEYKDAQEEGLKQSVTNQIMDQVDKSRYDQEFQLHTIDLYRKINQAVAEYAGAHQIGLVFVADAADLDNLRGDQLAALVSTRKVMYFDPRFDITSAVLAKMNQEFQFRAPKKP